MTDQQLDLDAIETRAEGIASQLTGWLDRFAPIAGQEVVERARHALASDTSRLVDEVRRLRGERNRYRTAWRLARTRALSTGGAADRYAVRAREGQTALQDMFVALLAAQMERDEAQAEAAALKAVLAKAHTAAARSAAV